MELPVLIPAIEVLLLLLMMLWITIALIIVYRKHREKQLQLIEATFAEIVSEYLYPDQEEEVNFDDIIKKLRSVGIKPSKKSNVQYLIDLMLRTQRSLLGENYEKLELLFEKIPPYGAAAEKLKSEEWHVKASGIREIYEMDQEKYIRKLLIERNHQNIFVRREAQIALVVFLGWESLRFLPYLEKEMSLWQQIKIIEKLHDLYPEPDLKFLKKAYKSEKPFAKELLMRIIKKFDLEGEVGYILQFIDHPSFDMRETALYCISSFKLTNEQLEQVKQKFSKIPTTEQQMELLKYIDSVSTEKDLVFYKKLVYEGDEIIKMTTAEILWNNGYIF